MPMSILDFRLGSLKRACKRRDAGIAAVRMVGHTDAATDQNMHRVVDSAYRHGQGSS